MKRLIMLLVFAVVCFLPNHLANAQAADAPPPELNKLNYLLGVWKIEGTGYSPDGGATTKLTATFENDWMPGHFFLVLRSTYMDGTTGVAYMGYDKAAAVYTYDEFESTGYMDHSTGAIEGDTWKWTSGHHGTTANRDHFTMKVLSPASYSFKFESSADGSIWKTMMDGTAHKAK